MTLVKDVLASTGVDAREARFQADRFLEEHLEDSVLALGEDLGWDYAAAEADLWLRHVAAEEMAPRVVLL
jgi:hypothetical protein